MKKLLATILALVMALSLCTSAWATEGEDGTSQTEPVATVDETEYTDFDQAVETWKAQGGTLKLLATCSAEQISGDPQKGSGIQLQAGKNYVLDLNGQTLNTQGYNVIRVAGELTVKDGTSGGKINHTSGGAALSATTGGTLRLESGKVCSSTFSAVNVDGTLEMQGGRIAGNISVYGTVTIQQGIVDGKVTFYSGAKSFVLGRSGSNEHGTVYVKQFSVNNQTSVEVHLYSGIIGSVYESKIPAGMLTDCGVLFVENIAAKLPEGKTSEAYPYDGNTYYRVVDATSPVAKIGETEYYNLVNAAANLKDGETLILLADYTGTVTVSTSAAQAVIDLDGFNITNTSTYARAFSIDSKNGESGYETIKTFTVKNSKASGGKITGAMPIGVSGTAITVNLVIENVVLEAGSDFRKVNLYDGARIADTPENRELVSVGGKLFYYKVTTAEGDYIYGTNLNAMAVQSSDGKALLLGDYTSGVLPLSYSGNTMFTLDLGGHRYAPSFGDFDAQRGDAAVQLTTNGSKLTITNGAIEGKSHNAVNLLAENCELVLDNVRITTTGAYGIATNGSGSGTSNSSANSSIVLKNGSSVTANNGIGIYFPARDGKLTIDNSSITAHTGVQVCAGALTISGNSIIVANGTPQPINAGDGPIMDGSAISVIDREGYGAINGVTIENGDFKANAENTLALKAYKLSNGVKSDFDNSSDTITISGGTFSSDVRDYVADGKNLRVDSATSYTVVPNSGITIGTYTEKPTVASGYKAVQNTDGTWRVEKTSGGYYYYPSTPGITAELNGTNKSATDYPGGDYGLVFRSTAAFSTFQGVQVDGKTLAKSNYTAEEGSTVVYLKAAYLKTLAAGKHTITILSTAGNTSMDFTIGGKSSSPKTFDAGVGIYAVTAVLSMTGMAWTAKKRH